MNHPATHKHHDINRMHRLPAKRLSPRRQDQQLEDCCSRNVIILQWQWLCIDSFAFLLGASNQHTHSQTQSEWKKATDENVLSWAFRGADHSPYVLRKYKARADGCPLPAVQSRRWRSVKDAGVCFPRVIRTKRICVSGPTSVAASPPESALISHNQHRGNGENCRLVRKNWTPESLSGN